MLRKRSMWNIQKQEIIEDLHTIAKKAEQTV
jgi:hypothetical protein